MPLTIQKPNNNNTGVKYAEGQVGKSQPVIAIIDVGKTNKKLFLFNQNYQIVFERSSQFEETTDEDGFACENLDSLRLWVYDALHEVFSKKEFEIKAINFSAYGASFVHVGHDGKAVAPLYNYLKPYDPQLQQQFYDTYGGIEGFTQKTASPVLGNLNSGMQLYRQKYEKPEIFDQIKYSMHLPQYISYLVTGVASADITSIGCHTNLWDYTKNDYHEWVYKEGVTEKLPPIKPCDTILPSVFGGDFGVGIGFHDSSAALIPYLVNFSEPFLLISTGTWCISLNPFNNAPLSMDELQHDCLQFLHFEGKPVKASRLFAGNAHEEQVKRIATHFNQTIERYRSMEYDSKIIGLLQKKYPDVEYADTVQLIAHCPFADRDLSLFDTDAEAYHQLIRDIIAQQKFSTGLVLKATEVKRLFVDGGFSKNGIYMNLLAIAFPQLEVYSASMAQATSMGAALAIHKSWNTQPVPSDIVELRMYAVAKQAAV